MKYGARAIVWGHKVYKGKVSFAQVPEHLKEKTAQYLTDKGKESFLPTNDTEETLNNNETNSNETNSNESNSNELNP